MSKLSEKKCGPCEEVKSLPLEEVKPLLLEIPEWESTSDFKSITRTFTFNDFMESISFINKVADIAESNNHHPDINIHAYKKVTITLSTHSVKGLSESDFIIAAKIDGI